MGRNHGEQATPDLFSTETVRDASPLPIKPIAAAQPTADASSHRHVLPKNLRKAVKHLSDGELDLLHAATLEEMGRRGRLPPTDQTTKRSPRTDRSSHGPHVEVATISLTRGKINAVRAAFKVGIKPSVIARQFGISQSDVRKVLTTDASGAKAHRLKSVAEARRQGATMFRIPRTAAAVFQLEGFLLGASMLSLSTPLVFKSPHKQKV